MAKIGSPKRRRAVAYHEAGHAVALWCGHLRFESLTIEPGKHYDGRVLGPSLRPGDSNKPRVRHRLEQLIVARLAGREAQRLVTGRYDHRDFAGELCSTTSDRRCVNDLMDRIVGESKQQRRHYSTWLRVRARELVEDELRRKAIDAVAEALLQQGTLTGDAAVNIILQAIGLAGVLDDGPVGDRA